MLSRTAQQVARRVVTRRFSSEAAASNAVTLNFVLPHETIYNGTPVYQVIIPGVEGEYGVTANHVPYVAQLKPGVLQILHEESGGDPEKYFVAGGYALTHPNSVTVGTIGKLLIGIRKTPDSRKDGYSRSSSVGCGLPRSCQA
jgi:ATP synthase, Delta/Epsilon chain, beta-sandwich domain